MALTTQRNPRNSFILASGGLSIGRIYKRDSIAGLPEWTWVIHGVSAPPEIMKTAGMAADFEQADAALKENWSKWLTWARLHESETTST